LQLSNELAG